VIQYRFLSICKFRDYVAILIINMISMEMCTLFVVHLIFVRFESKNATGNNIQRAYQQIMLTDYFRPAFDENLEATFEILCQGKGGCYAIIRN
jgi:hypothetical protein